MLNHDYPKNVLSSMDTILMICGLGKISKTVPWVSVSSELEKVALLGNFLAFFFDKFNLELLPYCFNVIG